MIIGHSYCSSLLL